VDTTARPVSAPDRTPAHGLAAARAGGDAPRVLRERLTFTRWLRTCPICGSDAVRDVRIEPVDFTIVHCLIGCGQCETWRAVFEARAVGRRLARRIERNRRRDRRRIARAARRAHVTDGALEIWLSGRSPAQSPVGGSAPIRR
jgi:hypothetical protein